MDTPTRAPGPWFVTLVDGDGILAPPPYLSVGPHPDDTADAFAFSGHYPGMVPDHEWARFRLIAAAPKMLAALKLAREFIVNGVEYGYISMPQRPDSAVETLPAIEAAIAEAEAA